MSATTKPKIQIPGEVISRLADVSYGLDSYRWDRLLKGQQARVREEAVHLLDVLLQGDSIYDLRETRRIIRQLVPFLKAIGEKVNV